jgi:16S rRNA (guanine527-N7)-methyltransferase
VLEEARELGFLGPGPVAGQIEHARGFAAALATVGAPEPTRAVDLGSGGGIPALVLAEAWPLSTWVFVESLGRRAQWLRRAVRELGWTERVEVAGLRAEAAAGEHREWAEVVTARSFGPPGVTAECAAGFLSAGGHLLVSDPPGGEAARWETEGLAELGLSPATIVPGPPAVAVMVQDKVCPERYPRRAGMPAKRPLF